MILQSGSVAASAGLPMETTVVVDDGAHNGFPDMVFWKGQFYLVYVSSPSHFASSKSRLVLLRSDDTQHWDEIRQFDGGGQDIRDPKFGLIGGRLFLYALLNRSFDPEPYCTVAASSADGLEWSALQPLALGLWLLGRPIAGCDATWYAPAHRLDSGSAVLLQSSEGLDWSIRGSIFDGAAESPDHADETAITLLDDGRMLAVSRLESGGSLFGSLRAATLISVAAPPFVSWKVQGKSSLTRLDGPSLFTVGGRIFALGRRQTRISPPFEQQGSAFGQKRSALFQVDAENGELAFTSDLPSSGDTSYAAAVVKDGKAFIAYYTSDPRRDRPWVLAMLEPTRIQICQIALSAVP